MYRSFIPLISLSFAAISALGCGAEKSPAGAPAQATTALPGEMAQQGTPSNQANGMNVPYTKPPLLAAPEKLVGASLPAIPLEGTEGESTNLKVVDAKPTVLVLWSTWCKSCLHETKELNQWAKSRRDVSVLAVNINGITGDKPDVATVRASAAELGLSAPIWITAADNLSSMGVRTCPTTFVVDAKGIVRAAHEGYKSADEMNRWLDTNLQTL